MKFSSVKKVECGKIISTVSKESLDIKEFMNNTLNASIPIIINGVYLLNDITEILPQLNDVLWIEPHNIQFKRTSDILQNENFKIMTSIEFTRDFLVDQKLTKYQTIIINNFHLKDPYSDLIISNSKFIQNERKIANITPLKFILLTYFMPIDFLLRLFDISYICDIDYQFNCQIIKAETDLNSDNYLEAVFQTIYLLFRNKIDGLNSSINTSQLKVLVFLSDLNDVKTAYKWVVSRIMNMINAYVFVVDNNEAKKNLTVYQSLLVLSSCSDKNVIDSLNIQFDYVIDSGYTTAKRLTKNSSVNYSVIEKIDSTESLVRSHYVNNPNGRVIQLYSNEIPNSLQNSTIDYFNYIKIRHDITDFIFCQIALGDKSLQTFSSIFQYFYIPLRNAVDNLVKSKLIKKKNSTSIITCDNNNNQRNKVVMIIKDYELTELGEKCLQFRPVNCQTALVLLTALGEECFISCLTLVSLLEVAEDLFTNLYDTFTDHAEKLKIIYDGNDDLLFLIKLFRHYVGLSKEERMSFVKAYSLNKACLSNATKIRTYIKEKFQFLINNKTNSENITNCFVAAYPFQIAKYIPREKLYMRPGQSRGHLQLDPYSFANKFDNPPEFVFYFSSYTENDKFFMKYVSPISNEVWDQFSLV